MSAVLGEGWLVPALSLAVTVLVAVIVPFGRWLAKRWRGPVEALRNDLKECQGRQQEERFARLFLEARLESCQREIEDWRSGHWRER